MLVGLSVVPAMAFPWGWDSRTAAASLLDLRINGWGITLRIQQITGDVLQVRPGAFYPALHRLEHNGWIASKWSDTVAGRRAKYYSLTRAGRRQLERETTQWRRLSSAVTTLLDTE